MGLDFLANIMNLCGLNLMFLVKKKTLFIKRNGRWINTKLEALANGGGIKGIYFFAVAFVKCLLGNHRFIHTFHMSDLSQHVECSYCRKKKE